jgi:hypothetical protein
MIYSLTEDEISPLFTKAIKLFYYYIELSGNKRKVTFIAYEKIN